MAGIGDWLPSVIDGVLGLFGLGNSAENRRSQEKQNQQNLDYAKAMTEKQWERDDSTYQRSVEDAVKAGFSPLAVLDGGLVPNGSPVGYQGQAPQFDINSMLNSVLSATDKLANINLEQNKSESEIKKLDKEFNNEKELLMQASANAKDEETHKVTESIRYLDEATTQQKNLNQQKADLDRMTELGVISTRKCTDKATAWQQYKDWQDAFVKKSKEYSTTVQQSKESDKESASAGMPKVVNGNIETTSESVTTQSNAKTYTEFMKEWFLLNPMPLNPDGTIPYNPDLDKSME